MSSDLIIPTKIRTARKTHVCSRCRQQIDPGEQYEINTLPPHRDPNDGDHWWVLATHADLGRKFGMGCDESAAHRQNAARNSHDAISSGAYWSALVANMMRAKFG